MKKYELIVELEVTPKKSKELIDEFLNNFEEWNEYKDEFIGNEKIEIIDDKNEWDEEYLRKHISLLSNNFSKKRLKHIKEVIEYLYPYEGEDYENNDLKKKLLMIVILVGIVLIGGILFEKMNQKKMEDTNQTKQVINKETNQIKMKDTNQTKK